MTSSSPGSSFASLAPRQRGMLRHIWGYLGQTKRWWLAPIIAVLLLFGLLLLLSSTAAAPFIYALF